MSDKESSICSDEEPFPASEGESYIPSDKESSTQSEAPDPNKSTTARKPNRKPLQRSRKKVAPKVNSKKIPPIISEGESNNPSDNESSYRSESTESKKVTTTRKTIRRNKKKVTQTELSKANIKRIPQHILEEILKITKSKDFCEDYNNSCTVAIHAYGNTARQYANNIVNSIELLKHARLCLLRRDWHNLARILALNNDTSSKFRFVSKYAALCLSHTDAELFDSYLQSIYQFTNGRQEALKICTKFALNS